MYAARGTFRHRAVYGSVTPSRTQGRAGDFTRRGGLTMARNAPGDENAPGRHVCRPYDQPFCEKQNRKRVLPARPDRRGTTPPYGAVIFFVRPYRKRASGDTPSRRARSPALQTVGNGLRSGMGPRCHGRRAGSYPAANIPLAPRARFVSYRSTMCRGGMYAARGTFRHRAVYGSVTPSRTQGRAGDFTRRGGLTMARNAPGDENAPGRHVCRPYDQPFCEKQNRKRVLPARPDRRGTTPPYGAVIFFVRPYRKRASGDTPSRRARSPALQTVGNGLWSGTPRAAKTPPGGIHAAPTAVRFVRNNPIYEGFPQGPTGGSIPFIFFKKAWHG